VISACAGVWDHYVRPSVHGCFESCPQVCRRGRNWSGCSIKKQDVSYNGRRGLPTPDPNEAPPLAGFSMKLSLAWVQSIIALENSIIYPGFLLLQCD